MELKNIVNNDFIHGRKATFLTRSLFTIFLVSCDVFFFIFDFSKQMKLTRVKQQNLEIESENKQNKRIRAHQRKHVCSGNKIIVCLFENLFFFCTKYV